MISVVFFIKRCIWPRVWGWIQYGVCCFNSGSMYHLEKRQPAQVASSGGERADQVTGCGLASLRLTSVSVHPPPVDTGEGICSALLRSPPMKLSHVGQGSVIRHNKVRRAQLTAPTYLLWAASSRQPIDISSRKVPGRSDSPPRPAAILDG